MSFRVGHCHEDISGPQAQILKSVLISRTSSSNIYLLLMRINLREKIEVSLMQVFLKYQFSLEQLQLYVTQYLATSSSMLTNVLLLLIQLADFFFIFLRRGFLLSNDHFLAKIG